MANYTSETQIIWRKIIYVLYSIYHSCFGIGSRFRLFDCLHNQINNQLSKKGKKETHRLFTKQKQKDN